MSAFDDALTRLATKYNGNGYNASTNPGGLDNGGHTVNFVPALQDVATAGSGVGSLSSAAVAAADTATTKASEASASETQALAAKAAAEAARDAAAESASEIGFGATLTGFGAEPGAVSSSTSGTAGTALTVSRGDHSHDLGSHDHTDAASGGLIDRIPKAIGTTKGDLIGFSASATPVRLGVGAEGQVPRASSAAATGIAWGDAPNENLIVDGNFDYWFEGTSQTTNGYGSDTMRNNLNVGSTKTHSRQSFAPGETDSFDAPAKYFSRTVVSSVAGVSNRCAKYQMIEDVTRTAGRTATLSFMAKANVAKNIAIEFGQGFGTGGSPSTFVMGVGSQLVALTTSWNKYTITVEIPSISGKTLGTDNNDNLQITFWFDAGSSFNSRTATLGQQSGTFDIAQVKLELGSVATPFVAPDPQKELERVNRYYSKTFAGLRSWASAGGQTFENNVYFQTSMRANPSVSVLAQGSRANTASVLYSTSTTSCARLSLTSTAAGDTYVIYDTIALDARL